MSVKNLILFVLVALAVITTGCRSNPVRDVIDAPVSTSQKATLADVGKTIKQAGQGLGWGMREIKPGHIVATIYLRKHMAKVDIKYTTKNYSITYKDSAELAYDGTNIHKNYNSWVSNLDTRIQSMMAGM